MKGEGRGTRAQRAGLLAIVLLFLAVQIALFRGVRLDDAYITFRYAENIARGAGFVFNPGERLMGSTSPGECLLSAVVYLVVGHGALPSVMAAFGCVGWTAQAIASFFLLRRGVGELRAALVALGLAVGAAGSAQWLPLETNLACAGTFAAMALASESRWVAAAAACAFAGLMRPDAYLVAALLALSCVSELRLKAWRPAATLCSLAAPWPIFATLYFGSPLPQSALVKYHHEGHLTYARHIFDSVPGELVIGPLPVAMKLGYWGLAIAGAVVLLRATRRLWFLPAYGLVHAVAYVVLAPDVAFQWHLYPLAATASALALLAVATVLRKLPGGLAVRYVLAAMTVVAAGAGTARFAREYPDLTWFGARDEIYQRVSTYLLAHASPTDIVDAEEVGTLAYDTDLRMNDHAMLVTRYPGDVFWRLAHGRKTRLRWMVLNGTQLLHGREIAPFFVPFYENRPKVFFDHHGWGLAVVDLEGEGTLPSPTP
jgi:hypothetical protein